MNIRNLRRNCFLLWLLTPLVLHAQMQGGDMQEVKRIMEEMKATNNVGYDYSMSALYPNDQKDQIKGEVIIDNGNKFLYNNCDAFTMIYSSHWFYKADHRKKTVTIVNLDREYKNELKEGVEKDVFQNASLITFIDSVLFKFATIKSFNKNWNILRAELAFPKGMSIRNINLVYNDKKKALVSYSMNTFQPTGQKKNKTEGISESVSCSNFKQTGKKKNHRTDDYFSFNKGQITLKKYNKYKLYTKL